MVRPQHVILPTLARSRHAIVAIGCVVLAVPLAAHAYMGSFMRYSGDDYCYAAVLAQNGFLGAQWESYFHISTYNGNRFSLTLLSGLSDLLGPRANAIWPGLAVLLWTLGTYAAVRVLLRRHGVFVPHGEAALLAQALVVFTLSQAPDLYQSLYWRSAMLPYLAPLVLNTLLIGAAARMAREPAVAPWCPSAWCLVLIGLLSVLAGGLSETAALWQLGLWATALAVALAGGLSRDRRPGGWVTPAAVIASGTVLALILLATSPTNAVRRVGLPDPPSVLELASPSIHNTYLFLHSAAKHDALPALALILFTLCVSFGWFAGQGEQRRPDFGRFAINLAVIGALAAFLIGSVMAVSMYALSSYPAGRALIIAQWTLAVALLLAGLCSGMLLSAWLPPNAMRTVKVLTLVLALVLACLGSAAVVPGILNERAKFERWASLWDDRDVAIHAAQQAGQSEVHVMQLDHLIPNVGELSPDPGFWYNNCAESFYDIDAIIADLPGWDP